MGMPGCSVGVNVNVTVPSKTNATSPLPLHLAVRCKGTLSDQSVYFTEGFHKGKQ